MRRQECCQLRSPAFRVTLTWAWELRDDPVGVILRVGMISSLSLPSAAEGWGTSALLLPRSRGRGLSFFARAVFALRLIFSVTNKASMTHRTAAERHRTCHTQHGWEGKDR